TATDFVEYLLYRNSTTTPWTLLANLTQNWYLDTGLTNLETYWYMISAVDEVPNPSPNSTAIAGIPQDTVAPPAISTLAIDVIPTGNTLNITWNEITASDIYEYRVYRSTTPGFTPGPAYLVNSTLHPTIYYLDTGLTDGQTYYYKVLSVDDDNNYLPAIIQRSGTPADTVPPAQPANFTITNINGSLLLNWTAATEPDFVKYEILRNGSWILVTTIFDRYTNWYLDDSDNLFDSYYYIYELRVYDEVGYDSVSPPLVTPLLSPSGDIKPPANVTDLSAVQWGFGGYVRLSWTAPASQDIVYYNVYRSNVSGYTPGATTLIGTVPAGTGTHYYYDLDETLDGSGATTYYYRVLPVDDSNNSATGGNEVDFTPSDTIRPDTVLTFNAYSLSDGSIRLAWTASTPPDFAAYYIYRFEAENYPGFSATPENLIAVIPKNNTLTYLDNESNLHRSSWYTYKIFVADEVGYKQEFAYTYNQSVEDTFPPSAPTGLIVTNEGTGDILNITWNSNPELDVDHYDLYRNSTLNPTFTFVTSILGRETTFYQDTGLTEYENYSYYLKAVDDAGNAGPASSIAPGTPVDYKPPAAPSIVLTVLPPARIFLIISSPPDLDTTYYNIYRWNESLGVYQKIVDKLRKTSDPQLWQEEILPRGNYSYYVTALDNKSQEGPISNVENITISLYYPIFNSIQTNSNGDVTLNWTRNPLNEPTLIARHLIFRRNSSEETPILIANVTFVDQSFILFTEYGVPNGNWTYFLVTEDKLNGRSYYSDPKWVVVNDTQAPGAPTGVIHTTPEGIENITITWNKPLDTNFGADVFSYALYISTNPITAIPAWLPNITLYGSLYANGSVQSYPLTTYTFYNLPDGTYYFMVLAKDELNQTSIMSNVASQTVDTIDPYIIPGTLSLPPAEVLSGVDVVVNITIYEVGGFSNVWINFTDDGGLTYELVPMTIFNNLGNSTYIYQGIIPGRPTGTVISYQIVVVDWIGHTVRSSFLSYTVISEETDITWIIVLIGTVAVSAVAAVVIVSRARAKGKKKEYIAEELLPLPI
ncbi:MAG: fibronectin type III domain-containing protein, partial [Candidatus Helarchaeota archaeon]